MGRRNSKFSSGKRNEGELVSNFKIKSLDLESKLKGTITFAFYYKDGIMVGVDSRSSNEWRPEKPLKIYRMNAAAGWKEICSLDPLVISSSSNVPRVSSDDLIAYFRPHGNAIAAHRVAHRQLGKHGFYFHRLVFGSEDEASRVYAQTTPHGMTSPAILKKFPNRVVLDTKHSNVTLLNMNWSSKG